MGSTCIASASSNETYFGLQYTDLSYEDDEFAGEELTPTAFVARAGSRNKDDFGFEGRFGIGLSDDSMGGSFYDPDLGSVSAKLDFEIDTIIGVYATKHVPFSSEFEAYGVLGLSSVKATLTGTINSGFISGSVSDSSSENGLSYGIGANIYLTEDTAFNIEYISYLDKSDFTLTSLNVGAVFKY